MNKEYIKKKRHQQSNRANTQMTLKSINHKKATPICCQLFMINKLSFFTFFYF